MGMTEDLLKRYYGIDAGDTDRALSSHAAYQKECLLQQPPDSEINATGDNIQLNHSTKELDDNLDSLNECDGTEVRRCSRAIRDNEEFSEEDEVLLDSEDIISDIEEYDNSSDNPGETGSHKEHLKPQKSCELVEEIIQDSESDVSLLATKNKPGKRQTTPINAPQCAPQASSFEFTSLTEVHCNGTFFDISNANITEFPVHLLEKIQGIKMLYLENNCLTEIPAALFTILQSLQFLDVRHNRLSSLPSTVKHHSSLEVILLQGNQFQRIPLELCLIPNLKALQISDNPLKHPPKNVVELGFAAIMKSLRTEWNAEHPEEFVADIPKETKSALTILCQEPPAAHNSAKSSKVMSNSSSTSMQNMNKKRFNYKPSNRCRVSGPNRALQNKLIWLAKMKEELIQQANVLQKRKDRDTLKKWREDRRSFSKSMQKAEHRQAIPFGLDTSVDKPQLKKFKPFDRDLKTSIDELALDLNQLRINEGSENRDAAMELIRLHDEIQKLTKLQSKIKKLKRQNDQEILNE